MILVTAATAPVGRSIVKQLVAAGQEVRALTRDPEKAGLPAGAGRLVGRGEPYNRVQRCLSPLVGAATFLSWLPKKVRGAFQTKCPTYR